MFDINEFLNAPCVDETATVKHGATEFKIRRLNGAERIRYNDLTSIYDRFVYVLGRGLLSGATDSTIGEENAAKFLARYDTLSEALFCDVCELTQRSLDAESAIWQEVKKN